MRASAEGSGEVGLRGRGGELSCKKSPCVLKDIMTRSSSSSTSSSVPRLWPRRLGRRALLLSDLDESISESHVNVPRVRTREKKAVRLARCRQDAATLRLVVVAACMALSWCAWGGGACLLACDTRSANSRAHVLPSATASLLPTPTHVQEAAERRLCTSSSSGSL